MASNYYMRLFGVTIPDNKRIDIALTAIYGVGRARARYVLNELGIDGALRPKNISVENETKLRERLSVYTLEGSLRREVSGNIRRLKDIKCHRGIRHSKGLPVRGQRTGTNSRTVRGNVRKTMGSGKRKAEKR